MGRIEQAFRRAADLPAVDYADSLINIDEYPKERGAQERRTGFEGVASSPGRPAHDDTRAPLTVIASGGSDVAAPRLTAVQPPPEGSAFAVDIARDDAGSSLLSQRCRRVAAHLRDLQAQRQLKTLMVTSVDATSGTTRAVLNLALALANESGGHVLLIDADMRRPRLHQLARCANDTGLADVLSGGSGVPLQRLTALVHVLTAGSPRGPIPELASDRMGTLLGQCASRYDWVLVDAPTDSQFALGPLVHGAVLVVDTSTPFPVVEKAMTRLGADRIVATVLIGLEDRDTLLT
jgi:Mrp family chromosome partitioning ATPase